MFVCILFVVEYYNIYKYTLDNNYERKYQSERLIKENAHKIAFSMLCENNNLLTR